MVSDPIAVFEMKKGCITPLAVLFDKVNVVHVLIDDDLINAETINVHPGTNSATVGIKPNDLLKYVESCNNKIEFYDLNQFIGENAKNIPKKSGKKNRY